MRRKTFLFVTALFFSISIQAQPDSRLIDEFEEWIERSAFEVSESTLDGSIADLAPIEELIGNSRVVGLSESLHSAKEPMIFRNRLFRYLVEELNFRAIVLESGVVESRVLNDYVLGANTSLEDAVTGGITHLFDQFQQNHELIRWIRQYNDGLAQDAQKVQVYGMDVSGSPGNLAAHRKPNTALDYVLDYFESVDPESARGFRERVADYLPVLASTNDYGLLSQPERDALTAAIEDMNYLLGIRRFEYVGQSSEYDYLWAERAAVAARQTDSWFRRMPPNWTLSEGLDWTSESQNIRDRAMADNLAWVLDQFDESARILVFASVGHMASEPWVPPEYLLAQGQRDYKTTPFGYYAKRKYGEEFVNILNIVGGGEIKFCFRPDSDPVLMESTMDSWTDFLFTQQSANEYYVDLRTAPPRVADYLEQVRDNRNVQISTTAAFDLGYFVSNITHDCIR